MDEQQVRNAEFEGSFGDVSQCPQDSFPEFAFIGRSNVGKSSLINLLCGRKGLVRVSNSPGKTQTINFFRINSDQFRFVDLPGYGFAKVSKKQRSGWKKMIEDYLRKRVNLACVYLLIDSRIEPQTFDLTMTSSLGEWNIPFCFVFTKCDSPQRPAFVKNVTLFLKEAEKTWEHLPPHFITSAEKHIGQKELLSHIFSVLNPA